jgi:alkylhydroperoxidase family enzyme
VSDEEIDAIEHPDRWADVFDEPARWVLRLADEMSGPASNELSSELLGGLRTHFSEAERAELILVAGQANLNNRAGNAAKQLLGDDA